VTVGYSFTPWPPWTGERIDRDGFARARILNPPRYTYWRKHTAALGAVGVVSKREGWVAYIWEVRKVSLCGTSHAISGV
jgi:hypothetical protein